MVNSKSAEVLSPLGQAKLFLAFSRGLQALISIAQPALGAVIALVAIPDWDVVVIGFIAAWAGNNAAFAINDLLYGGLSAQSMVCSVLCCCTFA